MTKHSTHAWLLQDSCYPTRARRSLGLGWGQGWGVGLAALLTLMGSSVVHAQSPAAAWSDADWAQVLTRHVDAAGYVDYAALAKDRAPLDRYVAQIAVHSPANQPEWFKTREDQLAYYLNAYNALVFDGVLARGPEPESVWKGGLISGYGFFVGRDITVGAWKINLKKLEDDVVRERYRDPRIHAALNCASRGCPRLPQTPFTAPKLEQQLEGAMREFIAEERNVRADAATKTIYLSKIFDWFKADFLAYESSRGNPYGKPSVIDYINHFRKPGELLQRDWTIRFVDYDKGINDRRFSPLALSTRSEL